MVQEGLVPAGQYDLDTVDGYTFRGGEVMVLAASGFGTDGYAIIKARPAKTTDGYGPFFMGDEGTLGYGVYFGNTVVKTDTGFTSGADTATRLGPTTYAASGKATLWDKPGLYAVSLDALDPSVTEATWMTYQPGKALSVKSDGSGRLTTGTQAALAVATVVTYKVDEALVTTGGAVVNKKKLVIRFNPFGTV